MKYLLLILSMSILLSGELEVDGDLKVTGTIQSQTIDSLKAVIAELQAQMANLLTNDDCNVIYPGIQLLDVCGFCGGDYTDVENCPVCEDVDGNTYEIAEIGTQLWMAEDLKVTRYQNGSNLSYYESPFGKLYTPVTIFNDDICPVGWHVPSNTEWDILIDFLGGNDVAGGKIKEAGLENWSDPNTGATNEFGFTAMPSGYVSDGTNNNTGLRTYYPISSGGGFELEYHTSNLHLTGITSSSSVPVRCIQN